MTNERLATCGTCVLWKRAAPPAPGDAPPRYGTCRINPPTVSANGVGRFPVIDDTEWCGQHRPKDAGNGS